MSVPTVRRIVLVLPGNYIKIEPSTTQPEQAMSNQNFVVRNNQFGYTMGAARVPAEPRVEVTDQPHEIAYFANFTAAQNRAAALSDEWGFPWTAMACVDAAPQLEFQS